MEFCKRVNILIYSFKNPFNNQGCRCPVQTQEVIKSQSIQVSHHHYSYHAFYYLTFLKIFHISLTRKKYPNWFNFQRILFDIWYIICLIVGFVKLEFHLFGQVIVKSLQYIINYIYSGSLISAVPGSNKLTILYSSKQMLKFYFSDIMWKQLSQKTEHNLVIYLAWIWIEHKF